MTDIVERLRGMGTYCDADNKTVAEADDEIEWLRNENIAVSTHCAELIEQNATLLAALEEIANGWNMTVGGCKDMARAAIEKVKTNAVS